MIVEKILNVNLVLVEDEGKEKILMGKGIGFNSKKGDKVDPKKVERIFIPDSKKAVGIYERLAKEVPEIYFEISEEIIYIAQKEFQTLLEDQLFIGLTDHISYAVERYHKGILLQNRLLWEIKAFYKKEYDIGYKAIQMINQKLQVELPEEEAGNIAYYIVNATTDRHDVKNTIQSIEILKDILSIINYSFHGKLQTDSISYQRMVTHLQFFIQRLQENKMLENKDSFLYEVYQKRYPDCFDCVEKISDYIEKQMNIHIDVDEKLYLSVHVVRNTQS